MKKAPFKRHQDRCATTNAVRISEPLIGQIKVNYDLKQFKWVGSLTRGDTVCAVWHASQARSLEDARLHDPWISADNSPRVVEIRRTSRVITGFNGH